MFCQKLVNSNLHHQIHKLDYSKSLHIYRLQPIEIRDILQKQKVSKKPKWFVFDYILKERTRLTLIGRKQQRRALVWRWLVVNKITSARSKQKSQKQWKSYVFWFCRLILREITLWLWMEGTVFVTNTSVIVTFKEFNKRFAAISAIIITNFGVCSPVAISISNIMPSPTTWLHEISDFLKNFVFL